MVVKQSEAGSMYCVNWAFMSSPNKNENGCKGSDCMAWEFVNRFNDDETGYCGLVVRRAD